MINSDKPDRWKDDVIASVHLYNTWFLASAPKAYRDTRAATAGNVLNAFRATSNHTEITPAVLARTPAILQTLRMSTAPPIARDRLSGLADVPKALVKSLEDGKLPPRMNQGVMYGHLEAMCSVISELLDLDLYPWVASGGVADARDLELATTVVADRLCGAVTDPIIRNAQERRQLAVIAEWLTARGYREQPHPGGKPL